MFLLKKPPIPTSKHLDTRGGWRCLPSKSQVLTLLQAVLRHAFQDHRVARAIGEGDDQSWREITPWEVGHFFQSKNAGFSYGWWKLCYGIKDGGQRTFEGFRWFGFLPCEILFKLESWGLDFHHFNVLVSETCVDSTGSLMYLLC